MKRIQAYHVIYTHMAKNSLGQVDIANQMVRTLTCFLKCLVFYHTIYLFKYPLHFIQKSLINAMFNKSSSDIIIEYHRIAIAKKLYFVQLKNKINTYVT